MLCGYHVIGDKKKGYICKNQAVDLVISISVLLVKL